MHFSLRGQGNFKQLVVEPPILILDEELFIGKDYTETVTLVKKSDGSANYKMRLEGKNCEAFKCEIQDALSGAVCDGSSEIETSMEDQDSITLTINISSTKVGTKKAYFLIHPTDGIPLSFAVEARFTGPIVRIVEPSIDFGLLKINTKTKFRLNVENLSEIEAPVMIKHIDSDLSFADTDSIGDKNLVTTQSGNQFCFGPDYQIIPPLGKAEILVDLDCYAQEKIEDFLELLIENGDSQFCKF